ncbi:MAG: helix-turn-helix transcriptional regulator [Eubacteriales bacterium]|nr:helix-turn-helix transcriptional regulator [Eubacteriales bacterium]
MDQVKVGSFLKELRKEKNLTQENLAEQLNVSGRTISRWETGSNMPDIGMLVEIADFYGVSIPEIINGERKSENMNQETRVAAAAMAEYSRNEVKNSRQMAAGTLLSAFGLFVIVSALTVFPNESSWGSIYAVLGSIFLIIGVSFLLRKWIAKRKVRVLTIIGCMILLLAVFSVSDYIAVKYFQQVPRFRYETRYDSNKPDQLVYKTLFFTAIRKNPGTGKEKLYIAK